MKRPAILIDMGNGVTIGPEMQQDVLTFLRMG